LTPREIVLNAIGQLATELLDVRNFECQMHQIAINGSTAVALTNY
jgi:hypothetical protein